MAYTKQNWVDGTTKINAERMNHIEEGIKKSSIHSLLLKKEWDGENFIIDNGFDEIYEAITNGEPVYVIFSYDQFFLDDYQCDGTLSGQVTFVGHTQVDGSEYDIIAVYWATKNYDENNNEIYAIGGQYLGLTRIATY